MKIILYFRSVNVIIRALKRRTIEGQNQGRNIGTEIEEGIAL